MLALNRASLHHAEPEGEEATEPSPLPAAAHTGFAIHRQESRPVGVAAPEEARREPAAAAPAPHAKKRRGSAPMIFSLQAPPMLEPTLRPTRGRTSPGARAHGE